MRGGWEARMLEGHVFTTETQRTQRKNFMDA